MPHDCSSIAAELDALLVQRELFDWGGKPPGLRNPRSSAWRALQRRITNAQRRLRECIDSHPHPPHPPVPVRISISGIQSFDQNDGPGLWPFDTEDDEPYVLVFTLNVPMISATTTPPSLTVTPPGMDVVKVGPWENPSVDDDEKIYPAPPNVIWDANSGAITTPNDVFFIAALVENDNSDPEQVRTVVEIQMIAHLFANLSLLVLGNRFEFMRRMVTDMTGAVALATTPAGSGGVLDADDRIGLAQELVLTPRDLNRAFGGEASRMILSFRGDGDYRVFFDMRRA